MSVLVALVIFVLLLTGLMLLPLGVDFAYSHGQLQIFARVAAGLIRVYPQTTRKQTKTKKQPREKRSTSGSDWTKGEILDLIGVALSTVKHLRLHLHRLKLHFLSAFEDPCQTAMVYGYAGAAVNALGLPQLKQADIQLGVDFEQEQPELDGYLSVTIRVYEILKLAFRLIAGAIPVLWRRRNRRKQMQNCGAVKGKGAVNGT